MNLAATVDLESLAALSEGMSGAEVALVCREAGLKALSDGNCIETLDIDAMDQFKIQPKYVEEALSEVR